ncbi:MAG: cohesin domain-containing protein, partial [Bacteroidales bacterium]
MRKYTIILLFLMILVNKFTLAQPIAMRFPDTTVVAGNNIDIPIYVDSSLTAKNVMSYMLQFTFSQYYLQPIAVVVTGSISASFGNPAVNLSVPGKISIAGAGLTALSGSGTFIYIRFKALQSGGLSLNFTGQIFNFFNEGSPEMSFRDGYMYIYPIPSIYTYPDNGIITKGEQLQFFVSGGTPPYQWSVTNPTVASINSSGLLSASQYGFTKVVAQDNAGIKDTTDLIEIRAMRLSIPYNLSQWQGANIDIPVNTTDLTGLNIYSGKFSISFNQNILTAVGIVQSGTLLAAYSTPSYNINNPGVFSLAFAGLTPLTGSGTLIYIRFHVTIQNTGGSSINFVNGLFNEEFLPNFNDGHFDVINLPVLSVSPNTGSIVAGETQQFTVNGGGIPPFSWSVDDTTLASIDQNGLLTAKKSGIIYISVHDSIGATAISGSFQLYDTRINMPDVGACPSTPFFYYPIHITSLPMGESVLAVLAKITYNASYLTFVDIESNATLTQGWTYFKNLSSGQVILAGSGTSSFNTEGTIFKLKFSFKPEFTFGSTANVYLQSITLNEGIPLSLNYCFGNIHGSYPWPATEINGTSTVTQGQQGVQYSVPEIFAASDYIWTIPTGASIVSGNNTNTITVNYSDTAISGNITVMGHNDCGDGSISVLPISVLPIPLISTFYESVSNEWENGANWDHGVPGSITKAFIAPSKLAIVNSNNNQCHNLTITPLGKLTINSNRNLKINDSLIMQSDASGSASLITNGTLNFSTSNIERYIAVNNIDEFHQLSSPVVNQSISNGFSPSMENLYAWSEGNDSWIPFENPAFIGLNGSNNFVPGRGYAVTYPSTSTKCFSGNLNNGNINILLTLTGGIYAGWNFIGNPYPSAINWNTSSAYSRSMLENSGSDKWAYWVWNPVIGNYGCYISNGLSGTNGVTNFIASMQGFWVKVFTTGSFSVSNAAREHDSQLWLKSSTADESSIRLKVSLLENNYSDEIMINFGCMNDLGGAEKMFSLYQNAPELYSCKL